jgi:hypothetical protein
MSPTAASLYALKMLVTMKHVFTVSRRGSNTLTAALVDCFACGLFAGLRLGEWVQDVSISEIAPYELK